MREEFGFTVIFNEIWNARHSI